MIEILIGIGALLLLVSFILGLSYIADMFEPPKIIGRIINIIGIMELIIFVLALSYIIGESLLGR